MLDTAWFNALLASISWVALFLIVFFVAKWLREFSISYNTQEQLVEHDNPAVAVSLAGYYLGVVIVFAGAYLGPSVGPLEDLATVAGYSLLGIFLLNVARLINDRLVLYSFSVGKELLEDKNVSTGVVLFANYIASGLVVAGALHGEGGGVVTALVFFALGQVALVLFALLYEVITPYSLHREIESNNLAAGIGFAGALIAIGLIVMNAIEGDFVSWQYNLALLAAEVTAVFVYLVMVRLFFDKVLLSGADLNDEIEKDRNVGAGILEGAVSVGFAVILVLVV